MVIAFLVAENVLQRQSLHVGNAVWHVEKCLIDSKEVLQKGTDRGNADMCTLEVRGFKPGTSQDHISLFFESAKSKGGETVGLSLESNGAALVTFVDPKGWYPCVLCMTIHIHLCIHLLGRPNS